MARILYFADLEHAFDEPERIGRLAGLVQSLRDPDTLLLAGGDNTAPGVLATKDPDRYAAVPFLQTVEPDADTLGNHEFDRSLAATAELCRRAPQTWVCANLGDDRPTHAFRDEAGVVPWTVCKAGAETVGVVGVASPDTDDISPRARDLTFTDPVPAAREAVDALRDRGVDQVVVISHVGDDAPLARALDVPVVLGGHIHDTREETIDGTLVLRPGPVGKRLAEVHLSDGASSTHASATVRWHEPADAEPVDSLVGIYRERLADLGLDEVVATLPEPVSRDAKNGESAVGNFVADALRRATGADAGLMPGGTIREDDPLTGQVTRADLVSLVPFDNEVVAVELDGDRLEVVLVEAAGAHLDTPSRRRWYGQVSNVELVWDHADETLESVRVGGEPLEAGRTYTLATIDYAVLPNGLFPSLTTGLPSTGAGSIHDALAAEAQAAGIPTAPEGRIERRNSPWED